MSLKNWFLDINADQARRRGFVRVKALNLIRLEKDTTLKQNVVLNAIDVSERGIGFRATFRLEQGQAYAIVLHTPQRDISATVRIRWCQWIGGAEKAYEIGAEFESINEADRPHLSDLIRAHLKIKK